MPTPHSANPFYNARGALNAKHAESRRKHHKKAIKNHKETLEVLRGGILTNHVNINLGKRTKRNLVKGKLVQYYSFGGLITSSEGLQTATPIFYMNTVSQALTSSGTAYTSIDAPSSYFDMNPYQTGTSNFVGATTGLTIPPKPADDKCYFDNEQVTLSFTNGVNFQIEVSLYTLKSKCNHSITPLNAWDNGYVDQKYGQTIYGIPSTSTGTKAGAVTSGYCNSSVMYTNPKDSKQFNDLWNIIDVNTFNMDPQSTMKQNIHLNAHKFYNREKLTNIGTSYMNGTICFMVVLRGLTVIKDNSTSIGAPFQSQITPCSVRWFAQLKTTVKCVPENAGRLSINQYTGAYTVKGATAANVSAMGAADVFIGESDVT